MHMYVYAYIYIGILKIVKSLEESGLLIKGASETNKNQTK